MSSPLDRFFRKRLSTYDTRKGYSDAVILPDTSDYKISKLSMDPIGQTGGMDPLSSSLEGKILE
jgi:hypothetical protein